MYNQPFYQRTEIIHVNGENGAAAFNMMPNSQALLLDDTAPLVWLAQTDGAGYKTITPYEIKPYEKKDAMKSLEERIERIERMLTNEPNVAETKPEPDADAKHGA